MLDHTEDKIYLFGVSSGAYTARALAGMTHKVCIFLRPIQVECKPDQSQVGLLPAGNHQQIPFAYKVFSRNDDIGWEQSTAFKKVFSVDVEVEFVSVWYALCFNATGIPGN